MFGSRKESGTGDFIVFKTREHETRENTDHFYQIACVDPATDNYAIRVEKRWNSIDDPEHCSHIEHIVFDKTKFDKKIRDNCCSTYFEIDAFLDKYKEALLDCHILIIERQMEVNTPAIRVFQQTLSYFMNIAKNSNKNAILVDVSSKNKSMYLDAPKGMNRAALKDWGVQTTIDILKARNDIVSLRKMITTKKNDDLADCVLHIEALCKIWGLPLSKN